MEQLKTILNTVLRNRGKAEIKDIKPSSRIRDDIGLDSLDLAELTVRIEAEFDVDIFADGIVATIGEIESKIRNDG
jgi:acyl carrier protein